MLGLAAYSNLLPEVAFAGCLIRMPRLASKLTTDVILPMTNSPAAPYMDQITSGEKTYEFRKYRLNSSVQRVWLYVTAPASRIEYVCEIDPVRTRNEGDELLPLDGVGNREFNERHSDWEGYDYAYGIVSVWRNPIGLEEMRERYGIRSAPRGLVYLPKAVAEDADWRE